MSESLVIGVVSQKGGVGKSTLARMLGVAFASWGMKVLLLDYDIGQQTSKEWADARALNELKPILPVRIVDTSTEGFGIDRQEAQVTIVDAPGWSGKHTLMLARMSDYIVIPCGPAQDDIRPTVRLAYELEQRGIDPARISIVPCRYGTETEERSMRAQLAAAQLQATANGLPEYPSVRQAQNVGRTAFEATQPAPQSKAHALVTELANLIDAAGQRLGATEQPEAFEFNSADLELD